MLSIPCSIIPVPLSAPDAQMDAIPTLDMMLARRRKPGADPANCQGLSCRAERAGQPLCGSAGRDCNSGACCGNGLHGARRVHRLSPRFVIIRVTCHASTQPF